MTEGTPTTADDHEVQLPGNPDGVIEGRGGTDVLVGDVGGASSEGKIANIILILDTSGSMNNGGKLVAQKNAVNELLTSSEPATLKR